MKNKIMAALGAAVLLGGLLTGCNLHAGHYCEDDALTSSVITGKSRGHSFSKSKSSKSKSSKHGSHSKHHHGHGSDDCDD